MAVTLIFVVLLTYNVDPFFAFSSHRWSLSCRNLLAPFHTVSQPFCGAKDLVAQTRFVTSDLPMYEFLPSPPPSDAVPVVSSDFILSDAVPGLFLVLHDFSSSKMTAAGLLLLHAHRRLGYLYDRSLKRMVACGMLLQVTVRITYLGLRNYYSSSLLGLSQEPTEMQCSCS